MPEVTVNLPEGITLAQCSSLSARIYIPSYDNGGWPNYKNMRVYINDTQVYTDRNEDGSEAYPFIGNTDQWVTKTYDTSALELTDEMKALNSFKLGIGINNKPDGGGRYIYYVNEFTVSYDLNREPPVIPAEGAYYTDQYRNLFAEAGYDEETVQNVSTTSGLRTLKVTMTTNVSIIPSMVATWPTSLMSTITTCVPKACHMA